MLCMEEIYKMEECMFKDCSNDAEFDVGINDKDGCRKEKACESCLRNEGLII